MSRGPGKVEQAIIEATAKEPGVLIPLWEIAGAHGYDITTRTTMHSWRRAAHNLYERDSIDYQWVSPPVYGQRSMLCVSTPDADALIDTAVRERCGEVVKSRNEALSQQVARTEAQFVLDMLDTGRWVVADRLTGKPVDHHAAWLNSHH